MDNYGLWLDIFNLLDFRSQLAVIFASSEFKNSLFITDLYTIKKKYLKILYTDYLKYFPYCRKLRVRNVTIQNLTFLKNLKILDISKYHFDPTMELAIGDAGIKGLDLTELYADNNPNITDLSSIQNLKILGAKCYQKCGINDASIRGLDLVELDASGNENITTISFMKNLKILHVEGGGGINDESLLGLDLVWLNAGASDITKVSHMKNLKILEAFGIDNVCGCGIDGESLKDLDLIVLDVHDNYHIWIQDILHMKNLKLLCMGKGCHDAIVNGLNLVYKPYCWYSVDGKN